MAAVEKNPAERWAPLLLCAVLLTTFLVYLNVLHGEFQFDDDSYINSQLNIANLFTALRTDFFGSLIGAQRLITDLTFALNYELGGLAVEGYHLVNILLHLLTVVLVYFFIKGILQRLPATAPNSPDLCWIPFLVAAIFALHPLQTQAVSYVVQRAEVLGSIFYLLTLFCLVRFVEARGLRMVAYYGAGLALFMLGWSTKQIIVTVPLTLLAYALFFLDGARFRRALWGCVPFLLGGGLIGSRLIASFTTNKDVGFNLVGLDSLSYFLTQLRVLITYLRLVVWPVGQNLDHDYPIFHSPWNLEVLLAGFFWLGVVIFIIFSLRKTGPFSPSWRLTGFGLLWFLLLLAPTSSVIPISDVINEHRLYLALVGPLLTGVVVLNLLWQRLQSSLPRQISAQTGRVALVVLLLLLLGSLAAATGQRNRVWQTKLSLWQDVVQKSPNKSRPHNNLGNCYFLVNEFQLALPHYLRAVELDAENIEPYFNLALVYNRLGQNQKADDYFRIFQLKNIMGQKK